MPGCRQRRFAVARAAQVAVIGWIVAAGSAQAQLRIATYNTNNYASGQTLPRAGVGTVLEALGDQAKAGFARPLDILLVQEQSTLTTSTDGLVGILNGIYGAGTYARGSLQGGTTGGGRPAVIYNTTTVQLIAELEASPASTVSTTGGPRATLRHQFRPLGYDSAADFYIYNSHLKAVDDDASEDRRAVEVGLFRANADALGDGAHVIYAGDMNFYRASEAGFQGLVAAGPGQAFDPVNRIGSWNNSSSFRDVHTQSPVTTAQFDGQVTGGLDDRFDFQLVTGEVLDGRGFDVIGGSYWAFGNTGTHSLNNALSSGSVTALQNLLPGYSSAETTAVVNAIMAASDHLPVVADYQLPAKLAVAAPALPTSVLKGASVTGSLSVSNAAPVAVAIGADRLDYSVSGSGGLAASASGSREPLAAAATHGLSFDTSAAGAISGTLSVTSSSPQAAAASFSRNYTINVLDRASLTGTGSSGGDGGGGGGGGGETSAAFSGTFTFGSDGNVASFAYNGSAIPDVTVGNLAKVGVATSSSSGNFRVTGWPSGATSGSNAFTGSFDPGKYFEFTLTADAGKTLDMTALQFGIGRSGTGPRQWQWRSSVDGYAAPITTYATVHAGLAQVGGVLTNPDDNSSWTGNSLDLSGAAFEGLSAVTFRLYGYNTEASTGTGGLQGPLSFSGTVVSPAPGSGGGGGDSVNVIGPGDLVTVTNAAAAVGTQRAAAAIVSRSISGHAGWSVSGLTPGASLAAGGSLSGTAAFDDSGLLNGTYTGLFTLGFEHADQTLPGAAASDLGSLSWNLSTTVAGRTGAGSAAIGAGASFAGLGIVSAAARGTVAAIEAGTAGTSRTVAMGFTTAPGAGFFASDVLTLTGTSGDAIVLSLTYDPSALGSLAAESLFVGWLDTRPGSPSENSWVNAVLGNSSNLVTRETGYAGSWTDYQTAFSVASPAAAVGAWGVDAAARTVWAIVDHNSQFAAVPEPEAWLPAAAGLLLAARYRRACGRRILAWMAGRR